MNSYWIESTKNQGERSSIDNNYIADVCIIGAGICGLTTGYYLAKEGLKVIIVDKADIGEKVSGNTTAKITFQHNLIYDYLIDSFGVEFAFKYLESNMKAINNIKKIIDKENIDCDFEYQNNYIYTTSQNELPKIHNEIKALNILSGYLKDAKSENYSSLEAYKTDTLSNSSPSTTNEPKNKDSFAQFVTKCELPFKICGAITIPDRGLKKLIFLQYWYRSPDL